MIGSRAWRALVRRNLLYRRRHWLSTILEIFLPVALVGALVGIKSAIGDNAGAELIEADFPNASAVFRPLTFADYLTAIEAQRYCEGGNETGDFGSFNITGLPGQGFGWPVPMLKCDSRQCHYHGEPAADYCQVSVIGVANDGDNVDRANDFCSWLEQEYPTAADYELCQVFPSATAMNDYVGAIDYGQEAYPKLAMGIVFESAADKTTWRYRLRQNSTNFNAPEREARPTASTTPPTSQLFADYAKDDTACRSDDAPFQGLLTASCTGTYMYNGVLTFQRLVDDYILDRSGAKAAGVFVGQGAVGFVPFPTPAYIANGFYSSIAGYGPLLITLGLLYPVAAIISYVAGEKELRQKELLKMMSVTESDLGWAWWITFAMTSVVSAVITSVVSMALYENSSPSYLLVFWILSFLAVEVFCLTIATLTSKATRGVLIGLLLFFIGYFLTLAVDFVSGSSSLIFLLSLHPVAALSYGLQVIGRTEDQGIGLQAASVGVTDAPSGYTFSDTIFSLVIDLILWGFMTFYLNRVVRPDYGQALKPWFFLTRQYWCPSRAHHDDANGEDAKGGNEQAEGVPFEPVGTALQRQREQGKNIEIRGLSKTFGEKVAVDGLTLSMYSGQVSALLGHNGAGKTTTINCLTGAMAPDSGYAIIAGKDTRTQMDQIRQDIGICLQHDCLFPQLTVREHIQFFSRLKGIYQSGSWDEAEASVDQAIQDVALAEKRNTLSKNLSGGMKRKLSVAIAFCGGSKVVLLDEPTSGMDPFSRRFTWNVIRNYRQDRCIILTTHFMDEADILGDRIAIMAEGRLRCAGSSLFLKKTYGVGYQLTIEKRRSDDKKDEGGDSEPTEKDLNELVLRSVDKAALLSDVGSELSFQLPMDEASSFPAMFESLEKEIDRGSITSYGVSMTTLDEVFLLVARGEGTEKEEFASASTRANKEGLQGMDKTSRSRMDLENDGLFTRHLGALFKKRAAIFKRDKKAWICTTVLPSIFVLIGFIIFKFASASLAYAPLPLSLDDYNPRVDGSPRHAVAFNAPFDRSYTCQPGNCAYIPVMSVESTSELYFFCGYQGGLSGDENCTISDSTQFMETIEGDGVVVEPKSVSSVLESSLSLANSAQDYEASRYGAIFFTHDATSVMNDGTAFNASTIGACRGTSFAATYSNVPSCEDFGGVGYTIHYNYTALHVAPLYQALADEALLRAATNSNASIEVTIDPLPPTRVELKLAGAQSATTAWFLVVLSFPFIAGAFATFIVSERESKAKHLQTVAGVQPWSYWLSTFLWDVLNYQIPLWITVALMFAFNIELLTTTEQQVVSGVIVLLFLFGPASAGFTYCLSFAFTSPSLCNVFVIISGFLVGMGGPLAAFILTLIGKDPGDPQPHLVDAASIMTWILRFIPAFNLGKGLFNAINIQIFGLLGDSKITTVWSEPILLYEVIFLAWQSVVYLMLAVVIDKLSTNPRAVSYWHRFVRIVSCRCCCRSDSNDAEVVAPPDDDDVMAEQNRVLNGEAEDDLIVLNQLTKKYDNGKLAVNNLSFGIPPGECFGLLGINGAGKTTAMSVLTAEFPPTSGDARLAGFSVRNQPEKTRRRIGYCPQFDAHFANLTGREHVELYASVKGVPRALVKEAAALKLKEVGLSIEDSDRLCAGYSGGMKRRLSLACATIGQPQIVFLDECSTGVDPVARREIWQLISDMVTGGDVPVEERTSVILTTHSMEECEALCPRIAIMANGRLRCLGSAQRLKSKFGQGYQIEMRVELVDQQDEDYRQNLAAIIRSHEGTGDATDVEEGPKADDIFFNLEQARKVLGHLTGDEYLSSMVDAENPTGYTLWKDASSAVGATADEVAAFATIELRVRALETFVKESYPSYVLRERQDTKCRFEIDSEGIRLSTIFGKIEEAKGRLKLADYGVSQTSLEQVFNMHAAEAEKLKDGRNDG